MASDHTVYHVVPDASAKQWVVTQEAAAWDTRAPTAKIRRAHELTDRDYEARRRAQARASDLRRRVYPHDKSEGFKLVPKGKRKGYEMAWQAFVSGDEALAAALVASVSDGPTNGPAKTGVSAQ